MQSPQKPADTQEEALKEAVQELAQRIAYHTRGGDLKPSPVPRLSLFQRFETTGPISLLYTPSVCLIARGGKKVRMGDADFSYDPTCFLLTTARVPTVVQITEASRESPYLSLRLELDTRELARIMAEIRLPAARQGPEPRERGITVGTLTVPLVRAFHRLIDLLNEPANIPVLSPLIQREIGYRLLVSDRGARLRQIVSAATHSRQIAVAIDWLNENYKRPLRVEELAKKVNMSVSAFHHHFRMMTASSPLRFQKQLRLQEARRLMLGDHLDASSAAFEVGYGSASQFNREYKGLFGSTPRADINQLRGRLSL